jgi:predicted nucleic acid-binding protein
VSWLLDADVLSQPAKRHAERRVIAWLEREQARCYTSSIVVSQLAYWVRSREAPQRWLRELLDAMEGRVLGSNVAVAHVWAEQQRALDKAGLRMPLADSYIAATARRDLTIVPGTSDRSDRVSGVNPSERRPAERREMGEDGAPGLPRGRRRCARSSRPARPASSSSTATSSTWCRRRTARAAPTSSRSASS